MVDLVFTIGLGLVSLAALAWQYQKLTEVDAESAYDYQRSLRRVNGLSTHLGEVVKDMEALRQAAAKKASVRETEGLLAEAIAELVGPTKVKAGAVKAKNR